MKKIKQILAIIGIVLLVAMYLTTLIFALTDNSGTMRAFQASIVATVIIPVLIWAYTFIYKLLKDHYGPDFRSDEQSSDNEQDSSSL